MLEFLIGLFFGFLLGTIFSPNNKKIVDIKKREKEAGGYMEVTWSNGRKSRIKL